MTHIHMQQQPKTENETSMISGVNEHKRTSQVKDIDIKEITQIYSYMHPY